MCVCSKQPRRQSDSDPAASLTARAVQTPASKLPRASGSSRPSTTADSPAPPIPSALSPPPARRAAASHGNRAAVPDPRTTRALPFTAPPGARTPAPPPRDRAGSPTSHGPATTPPHRRACDYAPPAALGPLTAADVNKLFVSVLCRQAQFPPRTNPRPPGRPATTSLLACAFSALSSPAANSARLRCRCPAPPRPVVAAAGRSAKICSRTASSARAPAPRTARPFYRPNGGYAKVFE